ncbi:MAG: riboflavin synthase [bacterium]
MFTGIIEEKGKIISIVKSRVSRIDIESKLENKPGDSIAINGVCLTVVAINNNGFTVEVVQQTREITTALGWRINAHVNLERAIALGTRLGGHILLGHVDEIAKCVRMKGNEFFFKASRENQKYLIPKGSIGINGVSLTIKSITNDIFSVSLVPFTLKHTMLDTIKIGSLVNIEYDYFAKILLAHK